MMKSEPIIDGWLVALQANAPECVDWSQQSHRNIRFASRNQPDFFVTLPAEADCLFFIGASVLWIVFAYVIASLAWNGFAEMDATVDDHPRITQTGDHHPGDPLDVMMIGTKLQAESLMTAAGWFAAAALGSRSDLKIAADMALSQPDDAAPVSRLCLYGRNEDFAFEQRH